ncbi:MAG: hypothetical protein HOW73_48105 [Polyangiaceae bacterium]|nr:hypothetical protein [Polyangiaceae bacterium]
MRKLVLSAAAVSSVIFVAMGGCDDDAEEGCDIDAQTGCEEGFVCEEVDGAEPACFTPVFIEGMVFDLQTDAPIEGARVVARDPNDAPVSGVATTDLAGAYSLQVPAKRDASGRPLERELTLRADAFAYQTFPTPPRVALPIDLADAEESDEGYTLATVNTDIGLLELPDSSNLGTVSGTVATDQPGSPLVAVGGATGVADRDGSFTVFNVPAGGQTASAYLVGVNFTTASVDVMAGGITSGVLLTESSTATATVSGSVQIVNGGDGKETSVILVLEDTFVEDAARGEAPPGLRAGGIEGAWAIEGVPDGKYVVLAAFENDRLVRDPDTSIGGTEIQHITVDGGSVTVEGFKVTGALAVISPGAEGLEIASATPTFQWEDDSSEDEYQVRVFDAFGNLVWETTGNFDQGGSEPATVDYGGDPLESGMIYQFRATSIKDGTPISATEDLLGVFMVE